MSLIECPECKKEISDKGNFCPHCGYPLQQEDDEEYNCDVKTGVVILILGILGIVLEFAINRGAMLIVPSILLILAIILGKKCLSRLATAGIIISVIGLGLIAIEVFKMFLL